jgi:transketolase
MDMDPLAAIARRIRRRVIEWSHRAGTPHLGSSLSCVDLLTALYWAVLRIDPREPNHGLRDRFILSKGHAALALYVTLAERGFFGDDLLATYNRDGGRLAEHPGPNCAPGVEAATGSLGHGLPIGAGMALAGRIQGQSYRVFALLSDGECNEGSVWEAAMFAAAQRLENLVAIIDYNKWQATGRSDETMALAPLRAKWEAFGWSAVEIDGHDHTAIRAALDRVPNGTGRPMAVVAHTVKGRGVSFMEDDNNWHYRIPSADEVRRAAEELEAA